MKLKYVSINRTEKEPVKKPAGVFRRIGYGIATACLTATLWVSGCNREPMGTLPEPVPPDTAVVDSLPPIVAHCIPQQEPAQTSCDIVPNPSGQTFTMRTLIGDTGDRTLEDRGLGDSAYLLSTPETSHDAHPFTSGAGTSIESLSFGSENEIRTYRIDGDMFNPLATSTTLNYYTGRLYTETQNIFVRTATQYRDSFDAVGQMFMRSIYQIKFTHDDFGIPICVRPVEENWAACIDVRATDESANHRIRIKFLGRDWVLTKIDPPSRITPIDGLVWRGGKVILGKEIAWGVLNVGDALIVNAYRFRLDYVGDDNRIIVSIRDSCGNILWLRILHTGETMTYSENGREITLKINQAAQAYTFGVKWADISIFSDLLELRDPGPPHLNGKPIGVNTHAIITWKNRGSGSRSATADHLRSLMLISDIGEYIRQGDSRNIFSGMPGFRFTYRGLDLDPANGADYDTLIYEAVVTGSAGFTYVADGSTSVTREVRTNSYLRITSQEANAFSTLQGTGSELRVVFGNGNDRTALLSDDNSGFTERPVLRPGDVILKLDGTPERWVFVGSTDGPDAQARINYAVAGAILRLGYGDAWNAETNTRGFSTYPYPARGDDRYVVLVAENAGAYADTEMTDAFALNYNIMAQSLNTALPGMVYIPDKVTYSSVADFSGLPREADLEYSSGTTQRETGYITQRGSIISGLSDRIAIINTAKRVARANTVLEETICR